MTAVVPSVQSRHQELARELLPPVHIVIGSEDRTTGDGGVFEHVNPTTGEVQAEIPLAGAREVDEAVRAARQALPAWKRMKPSTRRDILMDFARRIESFDDWVSLQVLENGQPSPQATRVTRFAVDYTAYYAGWADKLTGDVTASNPDDGFIYTVPEPHGVIAVIITWNSPLLSLAMKIPPALAAGNTVVLKPAEFTPFSAMRFLQLAREAGIPDGVINIVQGGPDAGAALVEHPGVDKITFTGGPDTAGHIMRGAASNITPVLFELGGKGANLIFADADLDEALPFSCRYGMANSGQACAIPTRMLVERSIYSEVLDRVVEQYAGLRAGDPLDPDTYIGPLINRAAQQRVLNLIESAKTEKSGRQVFGGQSFSGELSNGCFVPPTVFADVDPASFLAQGEVFGPVLSVIPFDTEEQAIEIANNTRFGLANYIQSRDPRRIQRLVSELRSGAVAVNTASCTHYSSPFGGAGVSGFGREGGKEGIDEFVRVKTVLQR